MMQLKIAGNQVLPFWPFTTYQVVCHVHQNRLHVNLFVHIFRLPVPASEVVPPRVAEIAIAPAQSSMELGLELFHTVYTDETDRFPVLALPSTAKTWSTPGLPGHTRNASSHGGFWSPSKSRIQTIR
jgi:hypothetical protein